MTELEQAWIAGFRHALNWYGIWRDGVQTIGCKETPIKEARPQPGQMAYDLEQIQVPK